jgi:hypothetical protein
MKTKLAFAFAAIGLMTALPVWAHHSFAAEFDDKKPLKLVGTVTKMEWTNPHSWIHIDVKGPDGKVTPWMIEAGSPNALYRLGYNKDMLPVGTDIVVEGYHAKDSSNRGVGANLTFTNGKRLFLGGSAPGAHGDAPDPEAKK